MTSGSRHVVLIGMMGAGKTTVGEALAARLDRPFVDTDRRIEQLAGSSIPEIFTAEGEAGFRARETDAVRAAMVEGPAVVALGGGAVTQAAVVESIGDHHVVWLRATPHTLAERVGGGSGRPLLEGDPTQRLADLDRVRRALYHDAASMAVDVDDRSIDEVVGAIVATMEAHDEPGAAE